MNTKIRGIRVDDEQWARWQAAAEQVQMSTSDFIRLAVERTLQTVEDAEAIARTRLQTKAVYDLGKREVEPDFK